MTRPYIPIDDVLRALAKHPNGATNQELADQLGLKPANVAARLGKAFMYGVGIEKEYRPRPEPGRRMCVWRISR